MALTPITVTVTPSGSTNVSVSSARTVTTNITSGNRPRVTDVSVGTPISRVQEAGPSIQSVGGIDLSALVDGSVLVYSSDTENFEATLLLEKQNINGGQY